MEKFILTAQQKKTNLR